MKNAKIYQTQYGAFEIPPRARPRDTVHRNGFRDPAIQKALLDLALRSNLKQPIVRTIG